jgi:hypothetical protein
VPLMRLLLRVWDNVDDHVGCKPFQLDPEVAQTVTVAANVAYAFRQARNCLSPMKHSDIMPLV